MDYGRILVDEERTTPKGVTVNLRIDPVDLDMYAKFSNGVEKKIGGSSEWGNITGNIRDQSDLISLFLYENVVVVKENGSDLTGERGSWVNCFLTPAEAKNAAQPGDTIVVFPGSYSSSENLAKNGVHWRAPFGDVYISDDGIGFGVGLFNDSSEAIEMTIKGDFHLSVDNSNSAMSFDRYNSNLSRVNIQSATCGESCSAIWCEVNNSFQNTNIMYHRIDIVTISNAGLGFRYRNCSSTILEFEYIDGVSNSGAADSNFGIMVAYNGNIVINGGIIYTKGEAFLRAQRGSHNGEYFVQMNGLSLKSDGNRAARFYWSDKIHCLNCKFESDAYNASTIFSKEVLGFFGQTAPALAGEFFFTNCTFKNLLNDPVANGIFWNNQNAEKKVRFFGSNTIVVENTSAFCFEVEPYGNTEEIDVRIEGSLVSNVDVSNYVNGYYNSAEGTELIVDIDTVVPPIILPQ